MPLCQPLSFLCEWFASVVSAYLGFKSAFHLYSESRKVVKYINSCCWLLRQRPLPASNILQSALVPTRAVRNGHSYGYPQFRGDAVGRATHCPIGWHQFTCPAFITNRLTYRINKASLKTKLLRRRIAYQTWNHAIISEVHWPRLVVICVTAGQAR